ncbi:Diphthine methyl ester synthase [Drechslerella dactyloides]|uniref:diphthine methyl ester synthase n=1 Tax=Drechslerella dactyloides TaxID=74499 RepID=A0AAD6IUR3_DREDA|nr:Diphthine methyl ester synthase [Drechslerella dactyloides]
MVVWKDAFRVKSREQIWVCASPSIRCWELKLDKLNSDQGMPDVDETNEIKSQSVIAERELVESNSDTILHDAASKDIAFLVVGDPFGATTHSDLLIRARERKIPVRTIHNASIMNAVGACGLQLYNFGQTVSMVFFTDNWKPSSFYDRIKENADIGLHTLILLDIKVKEQSDENLARGRKIYEPPRYMTVAQCAQQMLMTEESRGEAVYRKDSLAIGIARLGSENQTIVVGTLEELASSDLGPPLHSLVLIGRKIHELEITFIRDFAIDPESFDKAVSGGLYDHRS